MHRRNHRNARALRCTQQQKCNADASKQSTILAVAGGGDGGANARACMGFVRDLMLFAAAAATAQQCSFAGRLRIVTTQRDDTVEGQQHFVPPLQPNYTTKYIYTYVY